MPIQYTAEPESRGVEESQQWADHLETFLKPFLERLDAYLDRRVVGNLAAAVASMLASEGDLSLTELGAGICGPDHAQAGVQRLDHALHHAGWQAQLIADVLWEQADEHLAQMRAKQERVILIHDSSVLEKAESEHIVGQSAVRSSRARRLGRTRKHLFNQVLVPIRVPGLEWEQTLLVGKSGVPIIGEMCWWQRQKGEAGQHFRIQEGMVIRATRRWGSQVLQVFDRGYASGHWLWRWGRSQTRFVVRWKKGNKLVDASGQERKAWEIARGKRVWGERKPLWDTHARTSRQTGVLALPVHHAEYPGDLFLVVVRQGAGREPWYLLTNEPVETAEQAWQIVYAYATRWHIEEHFRFEKHELHIETFRVQQEEAQRKLLMLVTLAASFLLASLAPALYPARTRLLHRWCQRADWRLENVRMPLYRLRWALSRLWLAHPPRLRWTRPYRAPTHITWPVGSLRWWMTLWHAVDLPFEPLA